MFNRYWIGVVVVIAVVTAVYAAFALWERADATPAVLPEELTAWSEDIYLVTNDGWELTGELWWPQSESIALVEGERPPLPSPPAPAVILMHQFRSDKSDFDAFVPVLLSAGYVVLTFNNRVAAVQTEPGLTEDLLRDVQAAVAFLTGTPGIATGKLVVIGASVGANAAFVASGTLPGIRAAVALSPAVTGDFGPLMGSNIVGFTPINLFVASDENDQAAAEEIYQRAAEPKRLATYAGYGHGRTLLESAEARRDILFFIEQRLAGR